jgi:hypothetical protein
MAGSNIVAVKRRLIAVLPGLLGIDGDYSYVGKRHEASDREYLYLGSKATGTVALSAMAAAGRIARAEDPRFTLAIAVRTPGEETTEAAEARAVELGTLAEEWLAGNWKTAEIPGLTHLVIDGMELESGVDDDGADALLTYTLQAHSQIR